MNKKVICDFALCSENDNSQCEKAKCIHCKPHKWTKGCSSDCHKIPFEGANDCVCVSVPPDYKIS